MKKYFAKTFMSLCALGISSVAFAQEATETAVEGGMYQALKTKFIEGGADFMSLVAIALIFGLAFCLERIIYLNLAETNSSKLLKGIEDALDKGDVEGAKAIARDTRGPEMRRQLTGIFFHFSLVLFNFCFIFFYLFVNYFIFSFLFYLIS